MRKIVTLLICFIVFTTASKAQYVNIPDSNFRSFLIAKYPTCFNTSGQMDTTCTGILNDTALVLPYCSQCSIPNSQIASTEGIEYFKKLKYFTADNAILKKLGKLPASLKTLSLQNCLTDTLGELTDSIEVLTLWGSTIKKLTNLPANLKEFNFSHLIDSFPVMPNGLKSIISCDVCWTIFSVKYIPNLPQDLESFVCFECPNLQTIPILPNKLKYLLLTNSQIKNIPYLPNSLRYIDLLGNQLKSLPNLPDSLRELICPYNQLTNLPSLPDSLKQLDCSANQLSCLPQLPSTLTYLLFDNNKISCIPNTIALNANINPPLPLCNATNNLNGCISFPVIQGNVYEDMNMNNSWDNNESGRNRIKISLSNGSSTFTHNNGFYEISADDIGAYTVSINKPNLYNAQPASFVHNFSKYDTLVIDTFALQPTIIKDSLSIVATPLYFRARPGFSFPYLISSENVGSTTTNPTIHFIWDSSKLVLDSTSNISAINAGNDISWSISNFVPGQMDNMVAYFRVKPTTAIGDSIKYIATINGGTASAMDSGRTIVRGSYDPNEKQATPVLTPTQCVLGKYIDYAIYFQNTGTDTAFTVVIADTLSSNLIDSSLQIINSSHNCKTIQNGNKIFFEFKNILLPDSNINEKKSHGFVSFKVKPKTTLVNGNTVENKASIYFDYNTPIVTNTAITQINTSGVVLPVQMNSYDVRKVNENKVLNYWTTATETNALLFNVQRSEDARTFKTFGKVLAKGNNNHYEFTDVLNINSIPSTLYYRLQIIDKDGSITYSSIKQIRLNELANKSINIYPNPAKDIVNIESKDGIKELKLINMFGKVISLYTRNNNNLNHQTINLKQLTKGTYIVQVTTVKGEVQDEKLIVE